MMSEEDYEIEFLDEDADLVEKCVLKVLSPQRDSAASSSQFLVEVRDKKRKLRDVEQPTSKKKKSSAKQSTAKTKTLALSVTQKEKQLASIAHETVIPVRRSLISKKRDLAQRKLLNIKIPDYDDPFCLPVVALRHTDNDAFRLHNWNQMCLDRFKESDQPLTANDKEPAVSSTREMTFQCALNKFTGRMETTVKSKIIARSKNGTEKPYTLETLLPVYREKTTLRNFTLQTKKSVSDEKYVEEVLLNKEVHREQPCLVAYKPNDKVTAVYEFIKRNNDQSEDDFDRKRCLKEMTVCKVCTSCYQTSWRGSRIVEKKNLKCYICSRTYVSVYSLLAHLKTHDSADVKKYKKRISALLATVVDYHYTCRLCQVTLSSIKNLKKHAAKHRGTEQFYCEVGQHTTY